MRWTKTKNASSYKCGKYTIHKDQEGWRVVCCVGDIPLRIHTCASLKDAQSAVE
jgi:hypothetical protein